MLRKLQLWPTVKKHLTAGKALYFSHGFGITFNEQTGIIPPKDVDVFLVAPKGSGTSLRRMFLQGRGLNSSYAIFQDATGKAFERVIALGIAVGSGYLFETDFKKEVYSDLTGERGTLMGAIQGIFAAQYQVLRDKGHSPSEAFNETVEELTQTLMPLLQKMVWIGCMRIVQQLHNAVHSIGGNDFVMQQRLYSRNCMKVLLREKNHNVQ